MSWLSDIEKERREKARRDAEESARYRREQEQEERQRRDLFNRLSPMVMRLLGDVGDLEYGRKPGWFGDDPKYQIAIHPPRDWTLQPGDFHSISIQLSWYRTSDDPCFRIEAENWVFVPGPSHPGDSGGGYHSAWKKDTKGVTEDELKAALRELLQSKK